MEIALEPEIPTYSGGLGVLAGDTIRSAADLGLDLTAVTLLHRRGYFQQGLDDAGGQSEEAVEWDFARHLEPVDVKVPVEIEGRTVWLGAWRYDVTGASGAVVPVYLLDSAQPDNAPEDRGLTDHLYGGGDHYRLCQETVLGIGGLRLLRALGRDDLTCFHLNEGHAALVILELLAERTDSADPAEIQRALEGIRAGCVFTTHTPVEAGHDQFSTELVRGVLGEQSAERLADIGLGDRLNMTQLALRTSGFVNGVAMRHGEVSRNLFPGFPIHSITNGIHPGTWVSKPLEAVFDRHIPRWREDALTIRYAVGIPPREIADAHAQAKDQLLARIRAESPDDDFQRGVLTIGFARRAATYKRATLIFRDLDRLAAISEITGRIQLVFAGKAHPADEYGKGLIREIFHAREALRGRVGVVYLSDYDMTLGRLLVAGCDVWLNTPLPPLEASGTSGMKAALNGVPSLSVLDGWWLEGHVEGVTGWAVGQDDGMEDAGEDRDAEHARALYETLEYAVVPTFYDRPHRFREIQRSSIALNASFFNTQRMLLQYIHGAYNGASRRD